MDTTRIDITRINEKQKEKESELLKQLLSKTNYTDVLRKDIKYTLRYEDPISHSNTLKAVILSNDIIRRPSSKNENDLRYDVIDHHNKLGEGGFSSVYAILSTMAIVDNSLVVKTNKQRVVKIQKFNKEELVQLANEVELSLKANNLHMKRPALVKTGEDEYTTYLVMRRLNGTDLYSIITQMYCKALDLTTSQRLTITYKLLKQLKNLHERGIIHRDIKPDNVMMDLNTGELELFDYGLSKYDGVDDAGSIQGTRGYIPLEVFRSLGTNAKSDIFSMSVVIAMLWYADEPGEAPEDVINYQFPNIFSDEKIDLNESEKARMLSLLMNMSKNERDERYTVDEALRAVYDIREDYVNRRIEEMMANRPKRYRLENGLFVNNTPRKVNDEPTSSKRNLRATHSMW